MQKHIIAIGGGEIGRTKIYPDGHRELKPIETLAIDKKIIELTGKEHPNLVFIGAAGGDKDTYLTAIIQHFHDRLGCVITPLYLADSEKRLSYDQMKQTILNADIIYVGGGNVTNLMNILKETKMDTVLKQAYDQGIIMSGNSAGGCVWFEYYDNDEDEDFDGTEQTLKTKKALGFVKGFFVPHWNTKLESGLDKENVSKGAIAQMLKNENKDGYALDEGTALWIQSDGNQQNITEIISKPLAKIYKLNEKSK